MDNTIDDPPINIPPYVKQLNVGEQDRSAEAILVGGDSKQALQYTVSVDGTKHTANFRLDSI